MRLSSSLVWSSSSFFFVFFPFLLILSSRHSSLPSLSFPNILSMYDDNPDFRNVSTQNEKFPYQNTKKTCKILVRLLVVGTRAICPYTIIIQFVYSTEWCIPCLSPGASKVLTISISQQLIDHVIKYIIQKFWEINEHIQHGSNKHLTVIFFLFYLTRHDFSKFKPHSICMHIWARYIACVVSYACMCDCGYMYMSKCIENSQVDKRWWMVGI